ncbi:Ig-like domain-containing protein [Mycobacterium sp. C3-094]
MCAAPRHRAARTENARPEQEFWSARLLLGDARDPASTRHARRVVPKYTLPVGRIGALAVSLGVGFAIANSVGLAHADTETATTSPGPKAQKADSRPHKLFSGTATSGKKARGSASPTETSDVADDAAGGTVDQDAATESPGDTEAADPGSQDDSDADELEVTEEEPAPAVSDSSPEDDSDQAVIPVMESATSTESGGRRETSEQTQNPPVAPASGVGEPDVIDADAAPIAAGDEPDGVSEESNARPVRVRSTLREERVAPATISAPPVEQRVEAVQVMTALVSGTISPFLDPRAPATAPWFDGLLAWVRRQIQHTFFNESPVYGPIESRQTITGQVLVDLNAHDPNGDPLKYVIVQPAHGLVTLDPITGQFIYTPTTVVTGNPLQDSFKVIISDGSEDLRGPFKLARAIFHTLARAIGIAERDEVTVTVPVTVNPIVKVPPVVVTTGAGTYVVGSSPVALLSSAIITDVDSTMLQSATVSLTNGRSGDLLTYTAPPGNPVTAQWNSTTKILTLSGSATLAQYEAALKAISFSTTQGGAPRIASITVKDDVGLQSLVAGVATVIVVAVPPVLVVTPLALGTAGTAVRVSPVVVVTDLDSQKLSSAKVTVGDAEAGDVLGYGPLPTGVTATVGEGSVTFVGAATVEAYQQLLQSITLTSANVGVKTVTFTLTDDQAETSIPVSTVVTFVGLPVATPPLIVTAPLAAGTTGAAVTVSPVVVITDIDSTELASATVTATGGTLGYGSLPDGVVATPVGNSVTFTGAASVAAYQQLLQSITLTSGAAGIVTVSFTVVDDQGKTSVPATSVVTVVGLPVAAAPLVVVSPVAAGTTGSPVTVSPVVVITDIDSTELASATVTATGGTLTYGTLPDGVTATPGAGSSVTFTGAASVAAYQQLLQSVTLTSGSTGIVTVTFTVTDDQGKTSVPATSIVTVLGLPVAAAPLVVVSPVTAGTTGSPVTVSPVVVITDIDSPQLASATVKVGGAAGAALGYGTLPNGVTATTGANSITFTGAASVASYQQLLQSITVQSSSAGIDAVSFSVTDDQGNTSALATTIVTLLGLALASAPLVVTAPTATGVKGTAIAVSPVVVISDVDSASMTAATVSASSGSLAYGDLPTGVTATRDAGSVTFTGIASVAAYQEILQSVTLTSSSAGLVTVSVTVTDDQGKASVPSTTVVAVLSAPVEIPPLLITAPAAAGTTGSAVTVSPIVVITDIDSMQLASATVTASGGTLGYGTLPTGVVAIPGAGTSVTFTGLASLDDYEQLLQSVTLTSGSTGIATVTFTVTDDQGKTSVPATSVVTVLGLPAAAAPLVVVAPVAGGTTGSAVTVSPAVVITDIDSTQLGSATVSASGGTLNYGALPSGVVATPGAGSVTFTGAASVAAYQQLLQSITLTSGSTGIVTVTFTVTDDQGKTSVPATSIVTVLGLPAATAPLVVVAPVAAGTTGQPIRVSPVVVLSDTDSDIESVVVTVTGGGTLGWAGLPAGITADDSVSGQVTFGGAATAAVYQQVLQSITLTSATPGLQSVSFTVTDVDGNTAALPAVTAVTVVGLGPVEVSPVLVVAPVAAGTTGQPITVSPVVVLSDPDSDIESVVVTVTGGGTLGWAGLPAGITADDSVSGQVTFTGAATAAVYQQLLQSITLTSATPGLQSVSFTVTDVDGNTAALPAVTAVTVVGLGPVEVSPILIVAPVAAGTTGQPIIVSPIAVLTDPDSNIESVVVTVTGGGTLGWGTLPIGITADDSVTGQVTFTGAASAAVYQQVLQSITLTSASAGISTVSFVVTDVDGNTAALPAVTAVTVVGLGPVEVSPILVVAPVAAGTTGQPITVSPIVVLTDPDSDIESVVVTVTGGGTLGWAGLPAGITADDSVTGQVTFTGVASAAVYQQVLQSLTLTSASAGISTVSFVVTDVDGNPNALPAVTAVTVVGLGPVEVSPILIVAPVAAGTIGQPIMVSPVVVLSDPDSDIESLVVTVTGGGTLGWATLPGGITADDSVTGQVTFSGAASAAVYQQVLQSITLTSASAGISTVEFAVTDVDGNSSLPVVTAVTVVGLGPVEVSPVLIVAPVAAGTTGQPVTVSPVVVLSDPDSNIESVVVTVTGGGTLGWGTLPVGIGVDDETPGQVTFTGVASAAVYQQVLQSITLTSAAAGISMVEFVVTDADGNSGLPVATAVTVVGLGPVEVSPVLIVAPVAAGTTGQPVRVSPVVVLSDPDSNIESVVVTVTGGGTLGWGTLPVGIGVDDETPGQVTFTGVASAAVYQQVLQSITLTSAAAGISMVEFVVTDADGNSGLPVATAVTVVGLGPVEVSPVLIVAPAAAGTTGQPVRVSPVVVLSDPDSNIESVVVTVTGGGTLGWGALPIGITADDSVSGQVTFTGAASAAVYQQLLQSITLTSASAGISTVSFTVTDVDGNPNALSAVTAVTVVGLGPVEVSPVLIVAPVAAGTTGQPITVSPIVVLSDPDSNIESVVVTVDGDGVLGWTLSGGISADDSIGGQVTFTGAASAAVYQQVLQSITLTSASAGFSTVEFAVTDVDGNSSLPVVTAVTVVGLGPVEVSPVLVVAPVAAGTTGQPITVSPIAVLSDPDSNIESVVVTVDGDGVLGWTLSGGISADDSIGGQVTFSGAASAAVYQQVLQSITLTSASAGISTVSFVVTDVDGNSSLPVVTAVTVVGLGPVEVSPILVVAPAAAGATGQPITVSPIAVLTDPDSDIESVVVTVTGGGTLGWGTLPGGIAADDSVIGQVTFTGAASAATYQTLLQSITLTSATPGLSTVSYEVTDADGNSSLPVATAVTVVGLGPVEVSPVLVVAPAAAGTTGQPITVSPVVVLTDPDSDIESVVVTVDGDGVLGWTLSGGISADDSIGGQVTFSGAASAAVYQQVLQSITLTSASAGVSTVSFTVTDADGNSGLPVATAVTVVGLGPVEVSPVLVVAPVAAGTTGQPVTVSPVVVLTDPDSDIESVVVTVTGGGTLGWGTLPGGIAADDSVTGQVTFTGAASAATYQTLLQSITLTSASAGISTVSFVVTDADGNSSLPVVTAVTVVGLGPVEVSPILIVAPAAAGTTGQPITVSPIVVLTDPDSDIESVVVTVTGGGTLGWGTLPDGIGVDDSVTGQVTFTGAASAAVYQQVLQSITLTSASAGISTVSFVVTDVDGNSSLPVVTAVTVVGLGPVEVSPVLVVAPVAAGTTGQPVTVSPVVVLSDPDSDIQSVVVTVDGDSVLGWTLSGGISADDSIGGQVTFSGAASAAVYQQVLQSITLTSASAGISTVSFVVTDVDGNSSLPVVTAVTVVGLGPVEVSPILIVAPVAAGTTGQPITVSPIAVLSDPDSDIESVVVTVTGGGTLGWGTLPGGITADDSVTGQVTFSGVASAAVYQQVLQSITLTSASAGVSTVSFTVTDADGNSGLPAVTAVTVVGLGPVEVSPVLVVAPVAAGTIGQPVMVSPVVVLSDPDSDIESVVVTVTGGGTLGWGTLPGGIAADDSVTGQVTFTGAASAATYQTLLQSITLTSATAGLSTVSFTVTDVDGNSGLPVVTAVTVVGLGPVEVSPILVVAPAAAGTTGQPITVSPSAVLTDPDSDIESVVVTVTGGGTLGWGTLPGGIAADDSVIGQVTFTGAASAATYQTLLQSITLTSASAGISTVSFVVTDVDGNSSLPVVTAVTVVGLGPVEVSPVLIVAPAAAGATGQPITVSPIAVLTDPDSDIQSVVVTVDGDGVLGWTLSGGISADDSIGGQVTFTGAASAAVYQQLLQSITLTSASAGVSTVSFTVTDADGNSNMPVATAVTVVGLPAAAPIVLTSIVSVPYTAGSTAVTVDPALILLDGDSDTISGATVTIVGPEAGDTLSWGTLPPDVEANFVGGVLTFEGNASVGEYQNLLRSVKFATSSTASTSVRTIEFTVTDDTLATSVAGSVAVTVLSLPILATPVVVTSVANVNYTAGSTATAVDPNLVLLDADSSMLSGAVVSIVGGAGAGETLSFQTLGDIHGSYSNGVLAFEGAGTLAEYQQVLRSVTYSTSSGALATIKSLSFRVTDADGRVSSPSLVAMTIVSAPLNVAPLVVTSSVNVSYTAGGTPLIIDGNLSLLDLDSATLKGATVKIVGNFAAGDVLGWGAQPGISGSYDGATGTLTFTGNADVNVYQQLLRSVTISTGTSALATIKTVSFTVTDLQNATSLPGSVAVTVVAAPVNLSPLVTTLLGPIYTAGNTAVAVNPLLTVLDLDSPTMQGASVAITGNFAPGDVLSFTPTSGIVGNFNTATGVLTFVGNASTATYQQLLRSVTFASGVSGTTALKTITFTVTDSLGAVSPNATALITQTANSAPVLTAPLGGGVLLLGAQVVSPTAVILDDSSFLDQAIVTITNVQSVDVLSFTATGNITGNYSGGVLTLSGLGTVAEYQSVLQSVRFSKTGLNLLGFRNITMVVRDAQGLSSNTASGTLTLIL